MIDFSYIYLMGRTRFGYTQHELEKMRMGAWMDTHRAYRYIYNFETKKMLYGDVEEEQKEKTKIEPICSLLED